MIDECKQMCIYGFKNKIMTGTKIVIFEDEFISATDLQKQLKKWDMKYWRCSRMPSMD